MGEIDAREHALKSILKEIDDKITFYEQETEKAEMDFNRQCILDKINSIISDLPSIDLNDFGFEGKSFNSYKSEYDQKYNDYQGKILDLKELRSRINK